MVMLMGENVMFFFIINVVTLMVHYALRKQYKSESYQVFICSIFISTIFSVGLTDVLKKTIRSGTIRLNERRSYQPPLYMDRPVYNNYGNSYGNSYGKKVSTKKKRV